MAAVKFKAGLLKNLLVNRNADTLYFVTDTRQLYKGNDLYSDPIRVLSSEPEAPLAGVLYIINGVVKSYTGSEWVTISLPATTDATSEADDKVMTAKAVKSAITQAVKDAGGVSPDDVINTVVSTTAGTITVTKGSTDESVKLAGVVYDPTYDASTRTITLPYNKVSDGQVTEDQLVIALGKDMVVSSGHYDKEGQKIVLSLSSGDDVEIPVGALVTPVEISKEENNALTEKSDGLYVKDLSSDINTVKESVAANTSAIEVINGEESVEGSIKNAIKQAKDYADSKVTEIQWETFEE